MKMMMMLILMIKLRRKKGKGSDKAWRAQTLSFSLFLSPWLFRAFVFARTLRAFREVLREKLIFEKFFVFLFRVFKLKLLWYHPSMTIYMVKMV